MFIGRETELNFLENYYKREGSQILVVYGQRGVGKTTLLDRFSGNKKNAYYAARACSSREQRYQWAFELSESGKNISRYPEYGELLETAAESDSYGKQIIMIDEFHHLIKSDGSFMPEAERFIDSRTLVHPVMLILCTSASGWVENSMIKRMGSAARSLTGLLKIREMKFSEIREAYPGYPAEDYIDIYAILGGLPGLWNSFTPQYTVRENMIYNLLAKESRLYEAMSVFLAEELREPAVYNTILAAMARGLNKLNDIYKHTGFSRAKISVYLKNLMELELVEKVYSFETDAGADTQKGFYRIINPYVRFYYRFLFSNQSLIQKLTSEQFYEQKVAEAFPPFAEEAYRRICRETAEETEVSVGEWIGKSGNLDLVTADTKGGITAACCCYTRRMEQEDYEWLLFCMQKAKIADAGRALYCEKGFSEELLTEAAEGNVTLRHIL